MILRKTDQLKPGMILAKPVYDRSDVLLLTQGTALSDKNILVLKSWGVTKVWVEGRYKRKSESGPGTEIEIQASIEKDLKAKFADVLNDSVMAEIMRVASKTIQERYLAKAEYDEDSQPEKNR